MSCDNNDMSTVDYICGNCAAEIERLKAEVAKLTIKLCAERALRKEVEADLAVLNHQYNELLKEKES